MSTRLAARNLNAMTTALWVFFISMQVFQAGNINYQQEAGYYEINPLYGRHPSKEKVYLIKAAETAVVYGATKIFPKYERPILLFCMAVQVGFFVYDRQQGISMSVRW